MPDTTLADTRADGPLRLLLVEDMPGDARLVELALHEAAPGGYAIAHHETLADLAAAVAAGAADDDPRPDALLLDLSLPDSSGLETVRRALDILAANGCRHVPVIVLTGLDDPRMGTAAIHEGAQDYIIKGEFNPHLLQRIVAYAIERKQAARRHALLVERHAMVLASLGEGVVEVDREGVVRDLNPAAMDLIGGTAESLVGRRFEDLLAADATPGEKEQACHCLGTTLADGGRRELFSITLRGPSFESEEVETDLVFTPLRHDGVITGAVIALRDLRGRNDAYRTLADHLSYEAQIMDMLREAVVTVDPQGIIIGCNTAFQVLFGHDDGTHLLGANLVEVLPASLTEAAIVDISFLADSTVEDIAEDAAEDMAEDVAEVWATVPPPAGQTQPLVIRRRPWRTATGEIGGAVFAVSPLPPEGGNGGGDDA